VDDRILSERMQAAADLAASYARPPGAGAARRRGRRRHVRAAGGVALLLMVAVGAPLTPAGRALWERFVSPPSVGAPTRPIVPPVPSGPLGQRATGPVHSIARGTADGRPWEYLAYKSGKQVCHGFREGPGRSGGGGGCEQFTRQTEPIIFGASAGRRIDGTAAPRFADGPVTKAAVRVQIALAGRAPINLQALGPPDLPVRFFVVVLPPTAVATAVTAYDRADRIVGHQDLTGLPTARPEPQRIGDGDTGWLAAILQRAGYQTTIGTHRVVTGTANGHRVLAWTTGTPSAPSPPFLASEGYGALRRRGTTTVYGNRSRVGWWAQDRLVWIEPILEPGEIDKLVDLSQRVNRIRAG
jgi:hypothetical protein